MSPERNRSKLSKGAAIHRRRTLAAERRERSTETGENQVLKDSHRFLEISELISKPENPLSPRNIAELTIERIFLEVKLNRIAKDSGNNKLSRYLDEIEEDQPEVSKFLYEEIGRTPTNHPYNRIYAIRTRVLGSF